MHIVYNKGETGKSSHLNCFQLWDVSLMSAQEAITCMLPLNFTYLRLKNIEGLVGLVVNKGAPDVWLCSRVRGLGSGDG